MEWGILLEPLVLPQLLAVAAMGVLAGALLWLDFNHPAHRVFALLLAFRGMSMLSALLRDIFTGLPPYVDPGVALYWANLFPYFVIPLPFLILRFASIYPKRRGWFAGRTGNILLVTLILAAELAYLVRHDLWIRPVALTPEVTMYTSTGPLALLLGAMWLLFGFLVLVFAYDHGRMNPGPRRRALLIVLTGIALNTVYESTRSWIFYFQGAATGTSSVVQWETMLALLPVLAGAGVLARQYRGITDPTERIPVTRLFLLLPFPALTAIGMALLYADPALSRFALPGGPYIVEGLFSVLVTGFWRLTLPFLVTYALLRFQLFDLDLKIKFAVKQTTLGGIFVFMLLLLSELLEGHLTQGLDDAVAILVAVGLTYLVSPVQRFAERVSDRVMPHTQDTPEFRQSRRIDVYRATLERSIEDGVLTGNEMRILAYLRDELGLATTDVADLERQVAAEAGLDSIPGLTAPAKPTTNPK